MYIVIAARDEAAAIEGVVTELVGTWPHVVVVDDGSRDQTAALAQAAGATVLRHAINRGQGAALQTGITYSLQRGATVVVTFDADGQHRAQDVPALLEPIRAGRADVALGSRFLGSSDSVPRGRRLLLRGAVVFTRLTSGVRLSDVHNGLRALSRRAAEHLDLQQDRMAHASELIDQIRDADLAYEEVAVEVRYTDYSLRKGQRAGSAVRVAFDYLVAKLLR